MDGLTNCSGRDYLISLNAINISRVLQILVALTCLYFRKTDMSTYVPNLIFFHLRSLRLMKDKFFF